MQKNTTIYIYIFRIHFEQCTSKRTNDWYGGDVVHLFIEHNFS